MLVFLTNLASDSSSAVDSGTEVEAASGSVGRVAAVPSSDRGGGGEVGAAGGASEAGGARDLEGFIKLQLRFYNIW